MQKYCNCEDRKYFEKNSEAFLYDERYGWLIHWVEPTQEEGYVQLHHYNIPISFCPMCGKELKKPVLDEKTQEKN